MTDEEEEYTDDPPAKAKPAKAKPARVATTTDKLVKGYLRIRAHRKELAANFKAEDSVLEEAQETLSAALLENMQENGVQSMRTKHGTVYTQEKIIPAGADWDAIYKWIVENSAFEMLERRIKSTFVSAYMEQNDGDAPPGVSVLRRFEATVRRKS